MAEKQQRDQSDSGKSASRERVRVGGFDQRLRYLGHIHRAEVNVRRRYEWRALTATLTFYALAAAYSLNKAIPLPEKDILRVIALLMAAAPAICSVVFLHYIHEANRKNKDVAHAVEEHLVEALNIPKLTEATKKLKDGRNRNWSFLWQAITILVCAFTSIAIVFLGH